MTYVIAFDFETFGPIPSVNGFTQLGAVVGCLSTGRVVDVFGQYASQQGYYPDNDCIESFWLKNPERYQETLTACSISTYTPYDVIELFLKWVSKHVEQRGSSIYLITDCSTFDSGILKSFSLQRTLKIVTKYPRDIIDTCPFYLGVAGLYMTEEQVDSSSFEMARKKLGLPVFKSATHSEHDHNPINDSTVIFEKWKFINDGLVGN